jgi:soluble lytic murein transglycosylase
MRAIALILLATAVVAGQVQDREPRLPAPAENPSETEALIQRARLLAANGGFREGAATWQTVAAREPVIATLAQREAVRSLIAAGDLEPALTALAQLGSGAPTDLFLRAADASRAAGTLDRAATLYRQARQSAGRTAAADDAALGLAATLEQDGKPREALEVLRDLQLTFRRASAYDLADSGARRLSAQLGGAEPLAEQDYDVIVDRLAGIAAFGRAVDVLIEWHTSFPASPRRVQIEATIVQHQYSQRENRGARARAETFLKEHPDSPDARSVFITLFRLDVREGLTADVEKRGRAILAGQVAGATLSDRQGAARLLAEYLVSVGQAERALGVYEQLSGMTKPRGERVDVLWRMAIASLRAGNRPRAVRELQEVMRLKPDSETERAATYWLAYAQDAAGAKTAARTLWAALARRYPFSYYGVRAAARLGGFTPEAALTFPDLTLRDAVLAHPDYQAAALLSRAGLLSDAAVYARRLNAAFRRDDAVALLAARASEAAGDHTSASTLMSSYFGQYLQRPAANLPPDFWSLAYPRAYWPGISAAAARHKVDPLLMVGLARQESHFDRTARSIVGALGLFQIMPYTAAELDPSFASSGALERLFEADVSAELAASLLAQLQARYQGAAAPTIASYNADKERVQVWWDAARGVPEELFIDSIPYRETRGYVRQVLANYAMYQRFAGQ